MIENPEGVFTPIGNRRGTSLYLPPPMHRARMSSNVQVYDVSTNLICLNKATDFIHDREATPAGELISRGVVR